MFVKLSRFNFLIFKDREHNNVRLIFTVIGHCSSDITGIVCCVIIMSLITPTARVAAYYGNGSLNFHVLIFMLFY